MGNSSKKTKALRGRKVKAVASAPPKVEVVGNVEETTPLFQTPVVAVPVGADFGESLRQQHVTTRVTTSTTRGLGWEEDDCVGWVLSMLLNFTWIVFGGGACGYFWVRVERMQGIRRDAARAFVIV